LIWNKGNKVDNENKISENNMKLIIKKNLINKLVKIIINIIKGLFIYLVVVDLFGFFNIIYCQPMDGESSSNSNNNVDSNKNNKIDSENKDVKGKSKEKNEDSYNISANVAKGMVKEAVEGVVEGITQVVPAVIGGMVGGSLGSAIIKASNTLPPGKKALLGIGTAVIGSLGVGIATGLSKEIVKNASNNKEAESYLSGSSASTNTKGNGDSNKDDFIASVLENEDKYTPLQMILSYEIILGILILVHIGIINLIILHKLYISSGLNIIGKLLSQKFVTKYAMFKDKITKIGNNYLIFLIILNVVFILFYVLMIIYANVELSNNLEEYINVHLNMKKNIIMLIFVKPTFIDNKNKIEKYKYFNAWRKIESKNININIKNKNKIELN
jgi:hypothetical protein